MEKEPLSLGKELKKPKETTVCRRHQEKWGKFRFNARDTWAPAQESNVV